MTRRARGRAGISAEVRDGGPAYIKALREGIPRALFAAGQVYRTDVVKRIRKGYTSGAFVTGRSRGSVRVDSPEDARRDLFGTYLRVGTNVPYMLYWELGHVNLYTRQYERMEVWVPAMAATKEAQGRAFARVLNRFIRDRMKAAPVATTTSAE